MIASARLRRLAAACAVLGALVGAGTAAAAAKATGPATGPTRAGATSATATGAAGTEGASGKTDLGALHRTTSMCIDQEIANRLAIKRHRRRAVDRLFVKQARHELTAFGGYFVSDLYSATYLFGAAYTYHMTEATAVEVAGALTHDNADAIRAIEDGRGQILANDFARVYLAESLLIWSPIHGKLRLGGAIQHFDIHLDGGVGVVDSQTSRGAAGVGGAGIEMFMGHAFALRFDARDHVHREELLGTKFWSNDLSLTLGLSVFLPMRN